MNSHSLPLIWRKFPERYNLIGTKCLTCKKSYFPRRKICPECRRRGRLVEEKMPREGKVLTFSKLFVGPEGFEKELPYFLAIIELGNGAHVLTQLVDKDDSKVRIGAKVRMVFRKISERDEEGPIAYGYKFRVVG
jgi:uncharacterized OB-fold protein